MNCDGLSTEKSHTMNLLTIGVPLTNSSENPGKLTPSPLERALCRTELSTSCRPSFRRRILANHLRASAIRRRKPSIAVQCALCGPPLAALGQRRSMVL